MINIRLPQVGDLVRIRVSGECPHYHLPSGGFLHQDNIRRHTSGRVARVINIHPYNQDDPDDVDDEHIYYVNDCEGAKHFYHIDDFFSWNELEVIDD